MRSLGLRRNPNIVNYQVGEWLFLPPSLVREGKSDFGGIWLARTKSKAYELQDYMKKMYSEDARVFKAVIDEVLYANSYRIKTNGVRLYEEILR